MTPIPISPFNKLFRYFSPHVLYYTKLLGQKSQLFYDKFGHFSGLLTHES